MNERDRDRNKAYQYRQQGFTWEGIGNKLGVSRKTARRLFDEYKKYGDALVREAKDEPVEEPYIGVPHRFEPLRIEGDAIVTCDWHVPLHSPKMVNQLFQLATDFEIKKLIIAGDFFNADEKSSYLPHQVEAGFAREREEGTNLLDAALDVFDDIYFSEGNHDYRIVKYWGYKYGFTAAMKWVLKDLGEDLEDIHFTDLDYVVYNPGGYDIRICHPQQFSTTPLIVARTLVPKYLTSVMTAHSHHFAQGVALDGVNRIFDGGGLFEPKFTQYIQRTTKHHNWVQGFHLFKDGHCYPYSPIYGNL